ncbi:DUF3142 domain-containing protein [Insolitispirillum peregrinum]|uniref:DUF3142 domain-containing protein n=1 Tax=Insolitispirillum peregrinum TaxID=80876 RepID=UPI00361C364A
MLAVVLGGILCASASLLTPASADEVRASAYRAFWLWAGVTAQPVLRQADELYLLYASVQEDRKGAIHWQPHRAGTPRLPGVDLWLVIRAETLVWTPAVTATLVHGLERWSAAGNRVVGVQVDFDAGTRALDRYGDFLRRLRAQIPPRYRLGITGLLDWTSHGDLSGLVGVVDEVVIQAYQGRRMVPDYRRYLTSAARLPLPFRVGLVQGGQWQPVEAVESAANFRGYVVFLLNPSTPE